VGRGRRPAPTEPNKNGIGLRKIVVDALRVHRPLRDVSPNDCGARSPAGAGLLADRLFRRYDLVDGGSFSLCVIALLIGLVQELVDDARALLLLDPSLLRFLLRGEDLVVYFVAH
jgi:hypothetical protein